MNKEFIIYEGDYYILEWYFDSRGKSKPLEYFEDLTLEQQKKAFQLFKLIADRPKFFNKEKFNYEEDQIFAFKPKPDRFLCFFYQGSKIIVTNAFEKKTDKLPSREKEKALNAKDDYTNRCKKGIYYD